MNIEGANRGADRVGTTVVINILLEGDIEPNRMLISGGQLFLYKD